MRSNKYLRLETWGHAIWVCSDPRFSSTMWQTLDCSRCGEVCDVHGAASAETRGEIRMEAGIGVTNTPWTLMTE